MIPTALHSRRSTGALLCLGLVSLAIAVLPASAASAASVSAATSTASHGACIDSSGVTVVVDFTDVGGKVEIGCASSDPANGRAALEAAGFTPTDSQPGLICAINANPDPCPTTFEGSFWSYWHSTRDGEWTSYQVGADSSDPAPGELEGWRYNDGSIGPGVSPADAAATLPEDAPGATEGLFDLTPAPTATKPAVDPVLVVTAIGLGVVALLVAVFLVVRSRRRRTAGSD